MARRAAADNTSAAHAVIDTAKAAVAAGAPIGTAGAAVDDTRTTRSVPRKRRTTTTAAATPMVQPATANLTRVKHEAKDGGLQKNK